MGPRMKKVCFCMDFLHDNWLSVNMVMALVLFMAWLIGYICNGVYGSRFDLNSCWGGVGAIFTSAAAGWGKWLVDSMRNSTPGVPPHKLAGETPPAAGTEQNGFSGSHPDGG